MSRRLLVSEKRGVKGSFFLSSTSSCRFCVDINAVNGVPTAYLPTEMAFNEVSIKTGFLISYKSVIHVYCHRERLRPGTCPPKGTVQVLTQYIGMYNMKAKFYFPFITSL